VFLRSRSRGRETWGLWILGLGLCVVSVLGLTGVFGEIRSSSRLATVVLVGVPLGLVVIGAGVVNAIRGWGDPGGAEVDDLPHAGDRSGLPVDDGSGRQASGPDGPSPDGPGPDGMIDR
jgi:hypothetical protein